MSTAPNYLVFFLVVFFFFSASKALEEHKQQNGAVTTVHIIDGMAKNSEAIQVRCSSSSSGDLGQRTIRPGDNYVWSVKFEKDVYYCAAVWGSYFASVHAFEPERDSGHGTVFWLVYENGFFLSWDNSSWVKKADWETE
ncbi:hypothetical protein SLEP1_g11564 [Rubroshorea leprosula]|nr:hypothetical protein SLEP1_g11564 [Rubroshorea leprosula]